MDREWKLKDCERAPTDAEVEYIRNPSPSNLMVWRDFAQQLELVLVEKTQKNNFLSKY